MLGLHYCCKVLLTGFPHSRSDRVENGIAVICLFVMSNSLFSCEKITDQRTAQSKLTCLDVDTICLVCWNEQCQSKAGNYVNMKSEPRN